MEQFKHLNLSHLKHIADKILHTEFSIRSLFAVTMTILALCVYALSRLV